MALIGKIRQNFWFVLIILGLALAAFVIMDMTSANRGNVMNPSLGSINGTNVDAQTFNRTENVLSQNGGTDANLRRENLWNFFVDKAIIDEQAEDLGLTVPTEELKELCFGQNLSPIIQQAFVNPMTGMVDRQQLAQIQNMVVSGNNLTPELANFWKVQEDQIITSQLQSKLTNMVAKAAYTPSWMAEQEYKQNNTRAQVAYVKVPFDAVSSDQVEVTDADIKAYINDNKANFTNDKETRVLEYITFPIYPTAKDSADIFASMITKTAELKNSDNASDSLYAINNRGSKPPYYYKKSELPATLADVVDGIELGNTYGPYFDNGVYSSVKVINKRSVADSVQARVIFRNAPSTSPALVESAKQLLDSLKIQIESGAAQFDSMAIANSNDGSSASGGDLGYITQGILPPALDNILFLSNSRTGRIYEATTDQGLFLIELTDIINRTNEDKYRLAYINAPLVPSQNTQDSVLDVVNDFVSENRTLESFRASAKDKNLMITNSTPLKISDYTFGNLGSDQTTRDMVRWAFDPYNEVGDVSPEFYGFQDPVEFHTDKYVLIALNDVVPAGVSGVSGLKDQLTPLVRNMKKGETIKGAIGSDLSAAASKYNVRVDTLSAVTMGSSLIPALGSEPSVVSAIFETSEGSVSVPVIGNSGVYLVKPIAVAEGNTTANIPALRTNFERQSRIKIGGSLLESLKKKAKIKDERYTNGY